MNDIHDQFQSLVDRLVTEHSLAVEQLTERQLADAIRQAIASGDFQRHITTDGRQAVVYIPFMEHERMAGRIRDLENAIADVMSHRHEDKDGHRMVEFGESTFLNLEQLMKADQP